MIKFLSGNILKVVGNTFEDLLAVKAREERITAHCPFTGNKLFFLLNTRFRSINRHL